jgi:hypothetical protein
MYRYRAPLHQCNATMYRYNAAMHQYDASLYQYKAPLYRCNAAFPRCDEASSSIGGEECADEVGLVGIQPRKKRAWPKPRPIGCGDGLFVLLGGGSGTRAAGVSCWSFFLAAFSGSAAFRPRNGWRLKADSFSDLVP